MAPGAPTPSELARILLRIGAVQVRIDPPFRYASGGTGPIYCDNRLLISYVKERRRILDGLEARARRLLPLDAVAGTATAGIPHAAWLAERLELPLLYVRSKPKAHGRGRQVEGALRPGWRVLLVEDLVTTGGSALGSVQALRAEGARVDHVLALFSYDRPDARQAFADAGVTLHVLLTLPTLLEEGERLGILTPEEVAAVRRWAEWL